MEYNRIVAVTGLPGLYEIVSSKNDGALVRSVEDKSTKFISSRIHNLSHLESIEIYTTGENVNLTEVFLAMQGSKKKLPDAKDAQGIKAYFEEVYPNLDFARVYNSDMKKMVKWFELLQGQGVEFKSAAAEEGAEGADGAEEAAPKKKAAKASADADNEGDDAEAKPKKAAPKKKAETDAEGDDAEAKPKKKAAPKAEADEAEGDEAKPKKKAAPKKKKEDDAE
ncbi:DUF5606 domain-containing protein [Flaviaesturariibacter amylovorans]|uniref:DUF5606 domain-containing protein n=1 Tax=Flaviaesturariibacter amylovorans TaxID=1084520 RepID=A0ABP8HRT1_9BACT